MVKERPVCSASSFEKQTTTRGKFFDATELYLGVESCCGLAASSRFATPQSNQKFLRVILQTVWIECRCLGLLFDSDDTLGMSLQTVSLSEVWELETANWMESTHKQALLCPEYSFVCRDVFNSLAVSASSRARGSVVGWGTMLQAGRSWVRFTLRSLDFSTDLIPPAALWPWGRLNL
jgi:hypothetical protein